MEETIYLTDIKKYVRIAIIVKFRISTAQGYQHMLLT